jgi:hypothetical protein
MEYGEQEVQEEQVPEAIKPILEATGEKVENLLREIDSRINKPTEQVAEAAVQLTTGKQLTEVIKHHFNEESKILWGDVKAAGIGALSLIPYLGGAGEAATVELTEAAILEGASKTQARALARGAVVSESGTVIMPLAKVLGEQGAEKMGKFLKELDPFPDVPAKLTAASGIAEASGVEGAGLVPSGIQLLVNKYKEIKLNVYTLKNIVSILVNSPETNAVIGSIKERINKASSPQMEEAAKAFT